MILNNRQRIWATLVIFHFSFIIMAFMFHDKFDYHMARILMFYTPVQKFYHYLPSLLWFLFFLTSLSLGVFLSKNYFSTSKSFVDHLAQLPILIGINFLASISAWGVHDVIDVLRPTTQQEVGLFGIWPYGCLFLSLSTLCWISLLLLKHQKYFTFSLSLTAAVIAFWGVYDNPIFQWDLDYGEHMKNAIVNAVIIATLWAVLYEKMMWMFITQNRSKKC